MKYIVAPSPEAKKPMILKNYTKDEEGVHETVVREDANSKKSDDADSQPNDEGS